MLDGLLEKIQAGASDGLMGAAASVIEAQIEPLYAKVRAELLARCTGSPPPTFAKRLADRGWPIDEAAAEVLWAALIEAAADVPAGQTTIAEALNA